MQFGFYLKSHGNDLKCLRWESNMNQSAFYVQISSWGFPGDSMVKNPSANAGDARDSGWIPESGRSPGKRNGTHSSVLDWENPWTEEPGGLHRSPQASKESDMTEQLDVSSTLCQPSTGTSVPLPPPAPTPGNGSSVLHP